MRVNVVFYLQMQSYMLKVKNMQINANRMVNFPQESITFQKNHHSYNFLSSIIK